MSALQDRLQTAGSGVGSVALAGFLLGSAFVGFVALLVAGSALDDPGGWQGIALTAAWLLPLAGLSLLALLHPRLATPVLSVLTLLPVGFGVWNLADHERARGWENNNGPISLVLLVAVAAGLVVLGLARPGVAGVLLLVATLVPAALGIAAAGTDWLRELSIDLVTVPLVATGVLYLVAAARLTGAPGRTSQRQASSDAALPRG